MRIETSITKDTDSGQLGEIYERHNMKTINYITDSGQKMGWNKLDRNKICGMRSWVRSGNSLLIRDTKTKKELNITSKDDLISFIHDNLMVTN